MLLSSRLGLACYLLLPNRWGWACLSRLEGARVDRGNEFHNTQRPDYADPAKYQGGIGFDTLTSHRARNREQVQAFLDRVQPEAVLEIGPGSGYLTRIIATHPSVRRYVAVDINGAFLDDIRPRLSALCGALSTDFITGTVADAPLEPFDAVVMCSVVHHIPDRDALFSALAARLRPGGHVLAIDPTHYLLRLRKIFCKIMTPGHLAHQLELVQQSEFSTHAMCQLGEYRAIAAHTGFKLLRVEFSEQPRRMARWHARGLPLGVLWRWSSQEILVDCVRI
jgi:2-polyprenyl-3-methyl-5-hydroxy-6-metoxy-1,4-benzoquinol methylase